MVKSTALWLQVREYLGISIKSGPGRARCSSSSLRLKAQLETEGLFDSARKRPLPLQPRGIGLVTSTGAAALHDVVTALRRRVTHIPVVLVPAQVLRAPQHLLRWLRRYQNSIYLRKRDKRQGLI